MVTEYRHGIDTIEIDDGLRPIQTGPSNIIGVIGTAPAADPDLFPINEPILIAGDPRFAALLGNEGTLPDAINGVFDQFGADIIMIRVEDSDDQHARLSNVIGIQAALTGIYALKKSRPKYGLIPKLIIAPGHTAYRPPDGIKGVVMNTGGAHYTGNVAVTITGDGFNAKGVAIVQNGNVAAVILKTPGFGYTNATISFQDLGAVKATGTFTATSNFADGDTVTIGSTVYTFVESSPSTNEVLIGIDARDSLSNLVAAITHGSGAGTKYGTSTTAHATVTAELGIDAKMTVTTLTAGYAGNSIATTDTAAGAAFGATTLTGGLGGAGAAGTVTIGRVANPVVAEALGLLDDMRAIFIADLPGTSYEDALAYRNDFDSQRLWLVEGGCQVWDVHNNVNVVAPIAARLAGKQAYMDQTKGFWWSASNQPLNGVIGVNRQIDWSFTSSTVEGQLLNSKGIAVCVREEGFKVLGVRSPTSNGSWKFISVRRTADMVYDAIEQAMREAVDRPLSLGLLDWIIGSVNAYLRYLANMGAIIDGRAWLDPKINTVDQLANGHLYVDFDIEPPAPMERLTFRAHRNAGYYTELVNEFLLHESTVGRMN